VLDLKLIRRDPDVVRAGLSRRGDDLAPLEEVVLLDLRHRELGQERDRLRTQVKDLSRQVGELHRDGRPDEAEPLQAESRALGEQEQELAAEADEVADEIRAHLLRINNLPAADVPDGAGEDDNPVLRTLGPPVDGYGAAQRTPHWEIGEQLGILDLDRAVKLSGSMFVMYRGLGATLARALCQLALDRNADLYEEIRPPSLVLTATLTATGQLPKFADDAYHVERDDLWAIPTAEVPLTSVARDEILDEAGLPKRMMAHSPCFRREAGSAGRDTRGLPRIHEFDKVELFAYATAAQAPALQEEILDRARRRQVARGVVGLLVRRLSGPPGRHPLPTDRGQGHRDRAHRERLGPGRAPGLGRPRRGPPP
jgi:seryl-tRNA synthetase